MIYPIKHSKIYVLINRCLINHTSSTGVIRFHIARPEWQARVSPVLSHSGPRFFAQSGQNRFHSPLRLGHRKRLLAERGGSRIGRQWLSDRTGTVQHHMRRYHNICRVGLQRSTTPVEGEQKIYSNYLKTKWALIFN